MSSSSDEDFHEEEQDALDYLINEYIDQAKIKYQMRDYRQNLMERNRSHFPPQPFNSIKKSKQVFSKEFNIDIDANWLDDLAERVNKIKHLELQDHFTQDETKDPQDYYVLYDALDKNLIANRAFRKVYDSQLGNLQTNLTNLKDSIGTKLNTLIDEYPKPPVEASQQIP